MTGSPNLKELTEKALAAVAPPPNLTVSQWADKYRMLPQEGASEPGPWDTNRAPFQREPLDVITDPDVHEIVICGAVQLLKSEVLLNAIGYYMHLDPGPMIMVQPDTKNAAEFSNDRIAAMIEATPVLRERVYKRRGGGGKNSGQFNIRFQGGYLAIASANVPASLSSKPAGKIFFDETERYEVAIGDDGDPITVGSKRATNFWDYKIFKVSSPKLMQGRILTAYGMSDQREFYVPCPECGLVQTLKFGGKDKEYGLKWTYGKASSTVYLCEGCAAALTEADKEEMLQNGNWMANAEFNGSAGFRISSLYSPWFSWEKMVKEFLECKDDPTKFQTFINTRLAEGWEERGESVSDETLMGRREEYAAKVPQKAFLLTCGADVQKDRLEALVYAWGKDEEAWAIDHAVFWGNPDEDLVWKELESYLSQTFLHESGIRLPLSATLVDANYKASRVYEFVENTRASRVFASAGRGGWGMPIVTISRKRTGKDERKVDLHIIGVDEAKDVVIRRLRKQPPGPYTFHFPKADWCHKEFFEQLTAEKIVIERDKLGRQTRTWKNRRDRNEIWDMTILNYAGTKLVATNWQDWEQMIIPQPPEIQESQTRDEKAPEFKRVINKGLDYEDLR